jgi:hypothetical protein
MAENGTPSTDYLTHILNTTHDPTLRVAARLALIRARLAQACGQDTAQDGRVHRSPAQPSPKQPHR